MTEKYIILQRPKIRVPLWATDQPWIAKLSDTKQYSIDIFMEALFASLIYDSGKSKDLFAYLSMYDKQVGPGLVEQFVQFFKYTHPGIPLDDVSFHDIQLLANDEGCSIPIYKYNFTISATDEQRLVDAIIKFPDKIWERVGFFMSSERKKYGIEFYPKLGYEQDDILRTNFLRIHGLSEYHAQIPKPPHSNWPYLAFWGGFAAWIGSIVLAFHVVGGSLQSYVIAFFIFAAGSWSLFCGSDYCVRNTQSNDKTKRQRH